MPTRPLVTRYAQDLHIFPGMWQRLGLALAILIFGALPFVASGYWLTITLTALITVVGAVSLMILTGFTGQISLGHAAFLALGAYTAAILSNHVGLPFWLNIPIAGFVSAGVGMMVGPFALRLKGLYLAIVTLGLIFLVNHLLLTFDTVTGGVSGLAAPMHLWFAEPGAGMVSAFTKKVSLGPVVLTFKHKLYFIFLFIAAAAVWIGRNIHRSNIGRAMMAVRDQDLAASALGVNQAQVKIIAFAVSSFLAGVAGAMFAYKQRLITIDPPFNLLMSVEYVAMVILGGTGTIFGAVAGAFFFAFMHPFAEELGRFLPLLSRLSSDQQSTLIFSVIVIAFLIFEPLGLFGVWLRVKRYFLGWPFRY